METPIGQQQDARPVVVGVDGSRTARAAVRSAAREAHARGTALDVVLAFPWREGDDVPAPPGLDGRAVLHLAAGLVVEEMAAAARRDCPGLPVTHRIVAGRPVDVLTEESRQAQLVCVGTHGTGTLGDLVLGSTTAALVGRAHCPVLAVPETTVRTRERTGVVVGLDGSAADRDLAAFALAAAAARGCDLVAVRAWRRDLPHPGADEQAAQRRAETGVEDTLTAVREHHPAVRVHAIVEPATAARLLVGASLTAELVVVGHRHHPLSRLGSVTHALLHQAGCPVAVVPVSGHG
ncbi:universal stress protein [Modestobacter sp. SSW1-42]|uniref:universal stress protein n=1 Tax=Modestobacter sp. SSW1-42 TaxID=596372 RepID=UPI003985EBE3